MTDDKKQYFVSISRAYSCDYPENMFLYECWYFLFTSYFKITLDLQKVATTVQRILSQWSSREKFSCPPQSSYKGNCSSEIPTSFQLLLHLLFLHPFLFVSHLLSSPFCERTIEGHSVSWWTWAESTNRIEEVLQGKGFGHILMDQPDGERETGSSKEVWFFHSSTDCVRVQHMLIQGKHQYLAGMLFSHTANLSADGGITLLF